MPTPTSRAGMRRRNGKLAEQLEYHRRLRPLLALQDTRLMIRFWMLSCSHCVKRTGSVRRFSIACRSASVTVTGFERRGEPIGGGHRVLHRHIDADAADRRHRMCRVADAEQARAATISSAGRLSTLKSLMSSQLFNSPMRSARNGDIHDDLFAEGVEALRLDLLDPAFRDDDRRIASNRRGRA